ncbi:MAG: hypothetical protein GWN55_11760 [Phycisphaerae bacterium]|nr:hypothetical protein [Phycisphaerae bacterium]NIR51499.1 hypothetical protein [candidate division KSB1 bacterium]NIS26901.1 hypothetical protein [candidate division KSB1 bacterium]NIU27632.1 hypothetical protein [candidate division KSB1 bacterium]NIV01975.1 hypothetical protein [Phycisphaerae bacterium]
MFASFYPRDDIVGILGLNPNLYHYTGNNPINYIDPLGLFEEAPKYGRPGHVIHAQPYMDYDPKWKEKARCLAKCAIKVGAGSTMPSTIALEYQTQKVMKAVVGIGFKAVSKVISYSVPAFTAASLTADAALLKSCYEEECINEECK